MSSQNGRMLSTTGGGGSGAVVGMLGHNSSGTNNNTNNMNHTNSSQSVSWSQSTGGSNQKIISSLANHQHGAAPGTPTGADYEAKATAPPSPGSRSSSSSQGGTTLKEHDLLGLSDVSSSSAAVRQENSAQNSSFQSEELNLNLNLGATELRLGPQDGRRKMVLDSGSGSGFQYQRSGNTVAEQDSCPASETFLGGLDGVGMGSSVVTDRRSSNVDHNAANSEQHQGMEGGLSFSSLTTVGGEREQHPGTTPQGSRSDGVVEGTACRPLIESESLQKWHGGLDRNVSNNENLRLGMSLVQTKRGSNQEDMVEKKLFLNSGERSYQEKAQEGNNQQQLVSDDHHHLHPSSAYQERSWQERNQLNGVSQEDVSSADMGGGGAPERQMSERGVVVPQEQQQQQGMEKSEQQQLKHEAFQVEKRNLSEGGKALPALQLPEPRFVQDNMSSAAAAERSPMQADYVVQQKLWQSQLLMRSAPEFQQSPQQQQQMSHPAQQEESSRNGFPGGFPGSRMVFAPSTKPGVTGAKRPFDTIGTPSDARNFNDARSGLPSPVAGNNSSVINSNISLSEADAKSKAAQPPLYQPWSSKATPTWQMLQHSGGSFGPFPSQTPGGRNTAMPPAMTSSTVEGGASSTGGVVDPAQKAWEAHSKSLQQESAAAAAASLGQKMSSSSSVGPSDANPGPAQSPTTATEAASAPRAAAAPAVGWPPLRSFRKSTIASQPRPSPVVETQSRPPPPPPPQAASPASVASPPNSWFVKVYMDGVPIGRKVDLKTNSSYEKLSLVLEDMFRGFVNGQQTSHREMPPLPSDKRSFLHGSDYVLTYEDQDGDLMLVGDVPWTMFIDTVKRLRIMKGSEAIGLGTRAAEKVSKVQPTV